MTAGGFSSNRPARVRGLLGRYVGSGFVPGVVAVLVCRRLKHLAIAAGVRMPRLRPGS